MFRKPYPCLVPASSIGVSHINRLSCRKVALHEAFEYVPSKFINEKFKEHSHYYGAFFAILAAERSIPTAVNPPFAPLRARRVSSGRTSAALMIELREDGYEFEELKREIDSAQQRRKREQGTLHRAIPFTGESLTLTDPHRKTCCRQRNQRGSRGPGPRAPRKRGSNGLWMLFRHSYNS